MNKLDPQDPKFLGFWTRCLRDASRWSQEALAASSGLDVRTIQRIEAGKPVSITTRRALARGLGYDNPDVFEDPAFIKGVHEMFDGLRTVQDEEIQKQFPDYIRVSIRRVTSGEDFAQLAYNSNGYLFHADATISPSAKEVAASVFDYLRDLGDICDDLSFSDKLGFHRELDTLLSELERLSCACYVASRATKIVGANWSDKTPLPFTVGYLTVVPATKALSEIWVPRRLS